MNKRIVVIGAGLTGLTTAFLLKKKGCNVLVLEKADRVGGAMHTYSENGYVYEEGPNTGVVSNPEIVELFEMLNLEIETANKSAEKRLILKDGEWHPLPADATSFFKTPLFTVKDKFGILFEPLRRKGKNPDESVASLARRRIGRSFVDYAVNPFISGIYAGDPEKLVTRYALPKLYNLEQQYGSFIGGSFRKSREGKTEREKKVTRKVFSAKGGFGKLIDTLKAGIGDENIICNARHITLHQETGGYSISFDRDGKQEQIAAPTVISTVGSYVLSEMLPFIPTEDMLALTNTTYAKIIQVAVALKKDALDPKFTSFGGLIPQKEKKNLLGILFPSYCFDGRAPEGCSMLAIYLGGIKRPDLFGLSDENIRTLVFEELKELLGIPEESIEFTRIFRHSYAIPQYELSTKERLEVIGKIEKENTGLILAGNMHNGIGIADRIFQAFNVADKFQS